MNLTIRCYSTQVRKWVDPRPATCCRSWTTFGGLMSNDVSSAHVERPALPALLRAAAIFPNGYRRSSKRGLNRVYCRLLVILLAIMTAPSLSAAKRMPEMNELASAKGCDLCHRAEPAKRSPGGLLPYAPSWRDIALKYRRQKGAEDRLTQIVLEGSANDGKDRHWKGKVSEVGMLPNMQEIDEDQARKLVRWILSFAS